MYRDSIERDELRAKFTRWMEVTLFRARKHYLSKMNRQLRTVTLDGDLSELIPSNPEDMAGMDSFDFQEEKLSTAFSHLSPQKQTVLIMLIAEERKTAEVAQLLHCTPQRIYDQRYQALKALRKELLEGGESR